MSSCQHQVEGHDQLLFRCTVLGATSRFFVPILAKIEIPKVVKISHISNLIFELVDFLHTLDYLQMPPSSAN